MPSPKSPVQILADSLGGTPALKGFSKVFAGKNLLAQSRSGPSIVLFPVEAGYDVARDTVSAFVDVDLAIAAHLWGRSLDEVWDLRARYVAALHQQAIGNGLDDANATTAQAGFYIKFESEAWDTEPDTNEAGQAMTVIITARMSASDKAAALGPPILATSLELEQTLTAAMGANDNVAVVDSTYTHPIPGVLHIDGEMISYTGVTPTSFTGLTRGVNGTTAAAHLVGTLVYVSPT